MTKAQALQRVWKHVHASLWQTVNFGAPWLEQSPAPECNPLPKRDREKMKAAAEEVLRELAERASRL